jgi:membrane protein
MPERPGLFRATTIWVNTFWELIRETIDEWFEDKAERLGAALAYYSAFSLAPLLIIVVAVVDFLYGGKSTDYIRAQMASFVGPGVAETMVSGIRMVNQSGGGVTATIVSIVTLFIGATGVFTALQDSLNTIWEVAPRPRQFLSEAIRLRLLSFAMVLVICFLLLVSLLMSAFLTALSTYFHDLLPVADFVWRRADVLISFAVTTLLFALIYKVLPDVEIEWSDVWIGAIVTALLFTVGKVLIGLYLGRAAIASVYGAAGSILIVLAWVYYSSQILFFGAEFTQVYANRFGSHVRPSRGAITLTEEARIHQGIPHNTTIQEALRKQDPNKAA